MIAILFLGLVSVGTIMGCNVYRSHLSKSFKILTTPLKINNQFYKSESPLLVRNDTIYMSLPDVVMSFQQPLEVTSHMKTIDIKLNHREFSLDKLSRMVSENGKVVGLKDDFVVVNRELYVSLTFLRDDMGCHVYDNELTDSVRTIIYIDNYADNYDYSWTANTLVAHAMGDVDGKAYTNCLEAFEQSYEEGFRVFEVDLSMTADGQVAATHGWDANDIEKRLGFQLEPDRIGQPLTMAEFKGQLIKGKYVPLAWTDIVNLLSQYPDVYIITDTKDTEEPGVSACFTKMISDASAIDETVLERVIPQVYNEAMYTSIHKLYPWKSVIYTLYSIENGEYSQEIVDFVYQNSIQVVTTSEEHSNEKLFHDLYEHGVKIYMHTYDDENIVNQLKQERGIYGVYTNTLTP